MLGIFAYPRTGSTLVYEVIKQHYKGNSSVKFLGEAFNPVEFNRLVVDKDQLRCVSFHEPVFKDNIQLREERFSLVNQYVKHGYVIKFFPQDLRYPTVFNLVKENYKKLIVMKRWDIIDMILSALVAMEHRRFNAIDNNFDYHKFEANIAEVEWLCLLHNHFNSFVDMLIPNTFTELYYEDVINMDRKEIVERCGLVPNANDSGPLPLTKLLSKEEKVNLITNIGDVLRTISVNVVFDNLDISQYST